MFSTFAIGCRLILWISLCVLAMPGHAGNQEVFTKAVVNYELTLPLVKSYAAALDDLVVWSKQHPEEAQLLRSKDQIASLEDSISRLEKTPSIRAALDKNGLTGKDFALIPMALLSSIGAIMAEDHGATVPAGQANPANVAMIRSNKAVVETLIQHITEQRKVLSGGR